MSYLAAAASVAQGIRSRNQEQTNAGIMANEGRLSIDQANAQEGQVRRNSRQALGAQLAAFGASGAGYGGSSERALDQSAINQEMDALNTRYRGAITGYGYGIQSGLDTAAGNQAFGNGLTTAAGKLLAANSSSYTLAQGFG